MTGNRGHYSKAMSCTYCLRSHCCGIEEFCLWGCERTQRSRILRLSLGGLMEWVGDWLVRRLSLFALKNIPPSEISCVWRKWAEN